MQFSWKQQQVIYAIIASIKVYMVNCITAVKLNSIVFFVIFTIIKTLCHRLIPAFRIKECLELYVNQQAGGKAFPLFDDRSSLLVLPKLTVKIKKSRQVR